MSKKYKLLKDLPNARAGTILTDTMDGYYVGYSNGTTLPAHQLLYLKDYVENMSDWFEEVKPERIKVTNVLMQNDTNRIEVFLDRNVRDVTQQDLIKIKEAIQYLFNNTGETYSPFSNIKIDYNGITVTVGGEEYVSKKELRQIRMDAFIAARQIKVPPNGYTVIQPNNARFIDSTHYLDSIKDK